MASLYPRLAGLLQLANNATLIGRDTYVCAADSHGCLDIGNTSSCCANEQYCYYDLSYNAKCCAVGSNCDNPCSNSDQYLCPTTVTITSTSVSGTITAFKTQTTQSNGCCARKCPATSQYLCPASLGGQCCDYGFECGTSSLCLSTSVTTTPLVTISVEGCSSGQFSCASSLGGDCCYSGASCVLSDETRYCASGTSTAPAIAAASGVTKSSSSSGGLSAGAKAGIGVGVSLVACLLIGVCTWWCMKTRRARTSGTRSQQDGISQTASQSQPPYPPQNQQSNMSEVSSSRHPRTQTSASVPMAVVGPYTVDPRASQGNRVSTRAVPVGNPQDPSQIHAPVEIAGVEVNQERQEAEAKKEPHVEAFELP